MADNELLSAREAMSVLGINENDLQTLVARGDLRAFRAAGTMKFRREDVMSIKSDKGTEPTIIIPAAGVAPAAEPAPAPPGPTDEIVLEDVELMPVDDATSTQQVTSQQAGPVGGGATTVAADQTGEATVMEPTTAAAAPVPVAWANRGSGVAAPAMSRVRQAGSGVTVASSRRTHAIYQAKSANPVWTVCLVLTALVFVYAASICSVMLTKSFCDTDSKTKEQIIPPFLGAKSQLPVYTWCYEKTPGDPKYPKDVQ